MQHGALAVLAGDRSLARFKQRGGDVRVRYATGLVLTVDASSSKMPWDKELLEVAAAGAHGVLFERGSVVNGRHDREGWYGASGASMIDLRMTHMSSRANIVEMIKETFVDVPEGLREDIAAVLTKEMPSLVSMVQPGDDGGGAEDRPQFKYDEYEKRALHVLAMLGLEMRLSAVTTIEQYASAPAISWSAISGLEITAVKDVIAEHSNEKAVVMDFLRSLSVEVTTANVDMIRGLIEKMVTEPEAILTGLVGSSGVSDDVTDDVRTRERL